MMDNVPADYVDRVNRAIDYVFEHLDTPLKLDDVARAANFSPYHFHRIFKNALGETLKQFTSRIRMERALHLMSHNPNHRLTDVALRCGFASSSDFSRAFKQRFGVSPRSFDLQTFRDQQRRAFQDALTPPEERNFLKRLPPGDNPDGFEVTMRKMAARRVAYIRVLRPYEEGRVDGAFARLIDWSESRGLADGQWLGYMWEDPEIVPIEQCRYDAAVEVPLDTPPEDGVSVLNFPEMTIAELPIKGPIDLEQRGIDWIYRTWLPSSGFAPDHQPAFEAWNGRPFAHGLTHFELRIQLPVVKADEPL